VKKWVQTRNTWRSLNKLLILYAIRRLDPILTDLLILSQKKNSEIISRLSSQRELRRSQCTFLSIDLTWWSWQFSNSLNLRFLRPRMQIRQLWLNHLRNGFQLLRIIRISMLIPNLMHSSTFTSFWETIPIWSVRSSRQWSTSLSNTSNSNKSWLGKYKTSVSSQKSGTWLKIKDLSYSFAVLKLWKQLGITMIHSKCSLWPWRWDRLVIRIRKLIRTCKFMQRNSWLTLSELLKSSTLKKSSWSMPSKTSKIQLRLFIL